MPARKPFAASLALALVALAAPIRAVDLFAVDVGNGALSASGNDFLAIAQDLLGQRDRFAVLVGQSDYTAELDYLGVPNALRLEVSDLGNAVRLDIPSTGASVSFSGASPDEVESQVEDWLRSDGAAAWSDFLGEINGRSPLSLLDGNPRSTTALMSENAFRRFGLRPSPRVETSRAEVSRFGGAALRVAARGSRIEAEGFDDLYTADGSVQLEGELGRVLGLSFAAVGQYRDYEGARSYDGGLELALPLRLVGGQEGVRVAWSLTPLLQAAAGVSRELAAGGLVLGGGVANALAIPLGPVELALGNALTYYRGVPLEDVGGYDFETEVNQLLARSGARLGWDVARQLRVEGGASLSNFLTSDAAVPHFVTPFAAMRLRAGRAQLGLEYAADVGDGYTAHSARLNLQLAF